MKVARIKSARQFDVNRWRHYGIYSYGESNDFPQAIDEIVRASKTASACLDIYNDFIYGMGFSDPKVGDIVVNNKGMRLSKLRRLIIRDFAKYYGCALQVNYNLNYSVRSISIVPFEHCRLCIPDEDSDISQIAVYDDWGLRDTSRNRHSLKEKIERFDAFNPDPNAIQAQVDKAGGWDCYKGQILYYSGENEGELIYGMPKYIAEMTDMRTEEGLSNVTGRNVCSNFMLAGILVDIMDADQNEKQIQEKQIELMQFQGDENVGQLWYSQAKSKDEAPIFVPFSGQNYDKSFTATQAQIPDNIGQAFKQPPILRAKDIGANFGADLMTNCYKYYNSVTSRERAQITEIFEMIFDVWWAPLENADFTTKVLVFNAGASVAERLGKDLMVQVLDIVRDVTLTLAQKRNILQFGYGLYEDEIIKFLPNTHNNDDSNNSGFTAGTSNSGKSKRYSPFRNLFARGGNA